MFPFRSDVGPCPTSSKRRKAQTRINLGAEAMEPALTLGTSTPAHDHNPGERPLHRINYYGTLQDGAREGNSEERVYVE
ncbi:UNVERIFIED_CONTAM: hypothetical protein FKN15_007977 [Acipenser sinensis]